MLHKTYSELFVLETSLVAAVFVWDHVLTENPHACYKEHNVLKE